MRPRDRNVPEDAEFREQWELVNTPLGEEWSGRTRYAAAMFFHKRGDLNYETLEVYRLCSRLDSEDPLSIIRDRGVGKAWLERMGRGKAIVSTANPGPNVE